MADFRGLLHRAATDLRAEALSKTDSDQRERLLKMADVLDRYAEDAA